MSKTARLSLYASIAFAMFGLGYAVSAGWSGRPVEAWLCFAAAIGFGFNAVLFRVTARA